jgi:hypothetical protein
MNRPIPRWRAGAALGLVTFVAAGSGWVAARQAAADNARTARDTLNNAREELMAVAVRFAQDGRENALAGCQRTRADREDAITGWSRALASWRHIASDTTEPTPSRANAAATAAVYRLVVRGYRARLVDCHKAFPPVDAAAVQATAREAFKDAP